MYVIPRPASSLLPSRRGTLLRRSGDIQDRRILRCSATWRSEAANDLCPSIPQQPWITWPDEPIPASQLADPDLDVYGFPRGMTGALPAKEVRPGNEANLRILRTSAGTPAP